MIVLSHFRFLLLPCFHSLRIVCFFPFSWFLLQNKQNQPASFSYFIKITCNNRYYAQITISVADYSKRQLKTVRFPIWRALILTSSKWLRSLAATDKSNNTILSTATSNCDVTNVTYNENEYYVVTWTVYVESSMYLSRRWLRHQIVVMCRIACWFRSGEVLKFDQLHHSFFF